MAYSGSTAASSIANPPSMFQIPGIAGKRSTGILSSTKLKGWNVWVHRTTDSSTDLISNTYFTDGFYLGMREGDLIMGVACTGSSASVFMGIIGPVTTDGCGIASSGGHLSSTR